MQGCRDEGLRGGPYVVTLNWTPMLEWFVAGLVVKDRHHKDIVCYDMRLDYPRDAHVIFLSFHPF